MAEAEGAPPEAADELYLEPFDGFVAARDALVKRLHADGDADAAKRVRALRKPSRVAWAIDHVSGRSPKLRDALLRAGADLREAQERLVAGSGSSSDVRDAAAREREAVEAALEAAGSAAAEDGSALSAAALERARQTLHAVALDEGVRAEFEAHRLTGEHQAAGLGGFGLAADTGPAAARPKRRPSTAGSRHTQDDARAEAKRRREERKTAKADARELEKREREAERKEAAARKAAERAQRELSEATETLEAATEALGAARSQAAAARERAEAIAEGSS